MQKRKFPILIAISLILSILVGLLLQNYIDIAQMFAPLGKLYVNLIKMVMIPLVFSSLVIGISNISDLKKLGKLGVATVGIFMGTTAMAVIIGLFISAVMKPGMGVQLFENTYEVKEFPSIIDTFVDIVPSNPLAALVDGNMLQIIFFAVILGIGIVKAEGSGDRLKGIIESLFGVMSVITKGVMLATPIGIIGLMVPVVAVNGPDVLFPLAKVIAAFYIAVALQVGVVYCVLLKGGTNFSIKEFFKGIMPAQIIAFITCSSAAALPISMQCAQDKLKISKEVSGFVLPMGATVNMDGNALYQGIVAIFIAQAYGIEMTVPMMLMIVITGTLASIGAAGVPGAGMMVLSTVLLSVGLPVDGIALVAGIDRVLDMGRTYVNITGDAVTASVVEKMLHKG